TSDALTLTFLSWCGRRISPSERPGSHPAGRDVREQRPKIQSFRGGFASVSVPPGPGTSVAKPLSEFGAFTNRLPGMGVRRRPCLAYDRFAYPENRFALPQAVSRTRRPALF